MCKKILTLSILLLVIFLKSFGQIEEEKILNTLTGKISGTLLIPETDNQIPLVLIIAGSGPTDRDGNSLIAGENNSLKLLAEGLVEKGIASLRYDKRGIGGSKNAMVTEFELRFDHYVQDASDWIHFLKKDKRFNKFVIAGHSEGSLIGMIVGNKMELDAFVSIAGAGFRADSILRRQLAAQPDQLKNDAYKILDKLAKGETADTVNPFLFQLFRPSIQPYMINWFSHSPFFEIQKLNCPVLIMQGNMDLQINEDDANQLQKALPESELVILEGMNHVLKVCSDNLQENIESYSNPELPVHPQLIKEISNFILQNK